MANQVWWSRGIPVCPRCLCAVRESPDRWECLWCGFSQARPTEAVEPKQAD